MHFLDKVINTPLRPPESLVGPLHPVMRRRRGIVVFTLLLRRADNDPLRTLRLQIVVKLDLKADSLLNFLVNSVFIRI